MQILYITFIDFNKITSGSSLRPHKIYEAFLELGHDVKLLECQQNRRKERKKKVREVIEWLNDNSPDLCYVEPPTGPFFNTIDLKLLNKVHRKKIPIGLFYRDIFWKYPDMWDVPFLKKMILTAMHKRDLRVFRKVCSVLYLVGKKVEEIFPNQQFQRISYLPPGGVAMAFSEDRFDARNCIYVGGTSERYGGLKLIRAFALLNSERIVSTLTIISPETEEFNKNRYDYPWLEIKHTFDRDEVAECYSKATYAVIPFQRTPYMDLALPIKLFEYIGYGIPVISTDCVEIEGVIEKYDCGIICQDTEESIAKAVKNAFSNHEKYLRLKSNVVDAGRKNRWIDRAQQIVGDLIGGRI